LIDAGRGKIAKLRNEGRPILPRIKNRLVWESYIAQAMLRLKLWDRLSSERTRRMVEAGRLIHREVPPVLNGDAILNDPKIDPRSLFTPVFVKPSSEYVYHVEQRVIMEPEYGFQIVPPSYLIFESVPLSEQIRSRETIVYCSALPSFTGLLRARAGKLPVRRERAIVSMRFVFEPNYYHFIQDTLTRLALLDRAGVPEDVPLVVSKQIGATRFFKEITSRGALARRRWIVQDGFYIEAEEAYFARTSEGNREQLDHVMDLMGVPEPEVAGGGRRIFLTRDMRKRGRGILNMDQIQPVLDAFHFEVVDTDALSFDDQVRLFNETRLLVGIHGAGLTNIIFRRGKKLDLVEIFLPSETPLYFYILARTYGYNYAYVKGMNPDGTGTRANFEVDPAALRNALGFVTRQSNLVV
jgi:hypothetical protein